MEKMQGILNLLLTVPKNIREKLVIYSKNEQILRGYIELEVMFGTNLDVMKLKIEEIGGEFEDLGFGFGIITIKVEDIEKVFSIPEIQYIELPKTLYTSFEDSNKSSCINEVWNLYGLSGKGVLVGFIDSGIDYTHPAFIDISGNSRIEYIYDLNTDSIYNKEDINRAIKSQSPYSVVPVRDEIGHGTHVAGIACGGGQIDKKYYGVAYEASIAMVKMTREGKVNYGKGTQVMRGIKFLIEKSKELNMPLVINLSFSTNDGAHDGNSILEQYIDTVCKFERLSFVVASGNEGDASHHVSGILSGTVNKNMLETVKNIRGTVNNIFGENMLGTVNNISRRDKSDISGTVNDISSRFEDDMLGTVKKVEGTVKNKVRSKSTVNISISQDETSLVLQMYKGLLDEISFEIKSPDGQTTGVFPVKQGYKSGTISSNNYYIYNTGPKPFSINPEIVISIVAKDKFISSGIWTIDIYSSGEETSYDMWMPISEGLNPKTRFLNADAFNTIGIPATVDNVISTGSYDYRTNSISSFSGRGSTDPNKIKLDIVAPGEMIFSSIPMGGFDTLSGTSMACPHVAGACALLMQWGIVEGNDPYMYGERLKYYILKGAVRDREDVNYPSPTWGYGKLCLFKSLEIVKGVGSRSMERVNGDYTSEDFKDYIVEYDGDIQDIFSKKEEGCVWILDENYAIVSLRKDIEDYFFNNTKNIVYKERPVLYTLSSLSPLDTSNISKFHENKFLTLRGNGVLVGIVDTGIDYLNKEFMYEDDTTRILRIWDQTISTGSNYCEIGFGAEYTRDDINNAIKDNMNGKDPYLIVNTKDEIGHGTEMAGIIGARGRNDKFIGAAPDCEFVVVKLKSAKKNKIEDVGISDVRMPVYDAADVILGVKYLYNVAKEKNMPMVIYIPLESNMGSHDGNSILERYIDELSKVRGIAVVCGTGNQGDSSTHVTEFISNQNKIEDIEIQVDEFEQNLNVEIWCRKPDKVLLSIISPSGEIIDKVPTKIKGAQEFKLVFEGSTVIVEYYLPEEITGDELIQIIIKNVKSGIWQFRIIGEYIVNGQIDIWLPQKELLREKTRLLNSNPYTTLALPSTSERILCCSYYDQDNNAIVASSGRGYTRDGRIKPDVTCGGINVLTIKPGGAIVSITGSSAASAVFAGAIALILEWGIVLGNDTTMYSTKINTYIIRGTEKRSGDIYPNRQWGYGILDLQKVFEGIRSVSKLERSKVEQNIFINIPSNIINSIKKHDKE